MSSTLLSMEESAGGGIVSNLCSFQAKESQPHSLLSGEAVGRGYPPPPLWSQRSQRKMQVRVNESGGEDLSPLAPQPPGPSRSHSHLLSPSTSKLSLALRKMTVTVRGVGGIIKSDTAPPLDTSIFQHRNGAKEDSRGDKRSSQNTLLPPNKDIRDIIIIFNPQESDSDPTCKVQ